MTEIEWTTKELARLITLARKGMNRKENRNDLKMLFKLEIMADQLKRDEEFEVGFELSGHQYWRDHNYTDAPILTIVHLIRMLEQDGRSLYELCAPH